MAAYHGWRINRESLMAGPISCSMLKAFAPNPYAWSLTPDIKQTAAMAKGSLFDLALTDPDSLDSSTIANPFDSFRAKAAQEWRDEQLAAGMLIVDPAEIEQATKAADAVRSHKVAGAILDGCQFQVGVIGNFQGIAAKCLIDILPAEGGEWGDTLVDYKTTSTGLSDDEIRRTIGKYKYHWQAAFYSTLFNKVSEREIAGFAFIFQDTETLETRVVKLASDSMLTGNDAIRQALNDYLAAAKNGIVSRYANRATELELMPYQMAQDEDWIRSLTKID